MRLSVLIVTALTIALLGCTNETKKSDSRPEPPAATKAAPAIEEISSPAGAGAAEPFLSATSDSLLLSWLEPLTNSDRVALRFARFRDGQWSPTQTIVERNDLFVNWADFPSIVEDTDGVLFAHWLQKSSSGTYSYDVWMVTSTDGKTWGKPFLLNRDGTNTEHGFVTLAALPESGVGATWLDGRKMSANDGHEQAGHDSGGDMTIRYATVSANGEIAEDTEVDNRACECCTTGMTMTSSGPVIVYRDRSADEVRDISYVAKTADGWTKPARVHADEWKINACPVNGPQIDAIGKRAVTAWYTEAQDKGQAFAAFSDDGGVTFEKPVQIDEGKPLGRVDVVLLDEETALVTWLEKTAAGGEIRARKVSRTGPLQPSIKIADSSTARAAGFARMARIGADVYIAWTEQSATIKKIHVARGRF